MIILDTFPCFVRLIPTHLQRASPDTANEYLPKTLGSISTSTGDIEGCATIMFFINLFYEFSRFTCLILSLFFDYIMPESKAPPWLDPAPYVPNGGVYGYAMLQYRVKKKSGHTRPKHGGEQQPITS